MSEAVWHYIKDGAQKGPVTVEDLAELLKRGELDSSTLIWTKGMTNWSPAFEVRELSIDLPAPVGGFPQPIPIQVVASGNRRPTAGTVFGILCIVFGALGLLCMPVAILGMVMNKSNAAFSEDVQGWMWVSYGMGILCAAAQIVLGIGLLRMKRWARKGAVGYGWFAIAWGLAAMAFTFHLTTSGHYGQGPQQMGATIGGLIGGITGLIFPILLVIFLSRPSIKVAYDV